MGILMLVAAVLVVGAVLGLLPCLLLMMQEGLGWQILAIIGIIVVTLITDSGWVLLGGILGGLLSWALGVLIGLGREPTEVSNLALAGVFVGAVVGGVAGNIRKASRRSRGRDDF
jgi:hypothetical protein